MAYTTIDDPSAFFQTVLYTGNATDNTAITFNGNTDMQPDWVWNKNRASSGYEHHMVDSVRGVNKLLRPSANIAEFESVPAFRSFDSNGFTLGSNSYMNVDSDTQVSWCWKAGTSFTNDASSTSVGTIDSAGSVSTAAGFSIITWTGSGSAATIAHGLGAKLGMYIVKNRTDSGEDWVTYHGANTSAPETDYIMLNQANATGDSSGVWNDTAPTSSVFSVGTANSTNGSSKNMIAYCFSEVKGYSKFGSYIGNGNVNGSYIHLGFAPAFVLIKNINAGEAWQMFDNKRLSFNQTNGRYSLNPNSNAAEYTNAPLIDFLSNGFKLRSDTNSLNVAQNYIYMAFAEQPFVTSTGVPATAR